MTGVQTCAFRSIEKAEGALQWHQDAESLSRRVRAFDPFPGATAALVSNADDISTGENIKIWRASVVSAVAVVQSTVMEPGTVIAVGPDGIDVATGSGVLRLLELQRPGGKRLPVADFLQGFPVAAGQRFAPGRAN